MSMNQLLAAHYGTNASHNAEALEKQAQIELFAKVAADSNIDLNSLTQDQIAELWNGFFKTAEHTPEHKEEQKEKENKEKESENDDEEMKKKVEEAKKEHEEKKEAAAKLAEADFMGRAMAHAFIHELNKEAGVGDMARRAKSLVTGSKLKDLADAVETAGHASAKGNVSLSPRQLTALSNLKSEGRKVMGTRAGLAAAGLGAGGAAAHHAMKEKKSSALDELAAYRGVEKAAEAGWDSEEAAARLSSVLVLGAGESEKIATAQDIQTAVELRATELLELAGYPVSWEQ